MRVEGLASSWAGAVARYRKGLKREFLRTRLGVQSRAARKLACKKEFWQCRNKTELSCAGSLKTTGTRGTRRWPEALAGELFAANCSLYTPDGDVQGVEGMAQIYNTYETAFPDFRVTIEDTIAEGDRVAVRYTFTGTHNGPLGAIPASGNSLTESAIVIFRLAGGKVAEGRWAWDRVSVQQQIGALPRTSGQAAS